jgi:hypothetical protein
MQPKTKQEIKTTARSFLMANNLSRFNAACKPATGGAASEMDCLPNERTCNLR